MYEMMIDGEKWELVKSFTEEGHRVHEFKKAPCELCGCGSDFRKIVEVWE